ncbi:MAG: MFS transporter [Acidimicrobiales bacterium]|nr:MFS transporter [Acidimicrobiales bacterium]
MPQTPPADRLAANLRLIALHEMVVRANPWTAVFVLFTRSRFDLDGAVQLAGIYYLFVVLFEVPSGWMSDRIGRVPTIRIAAVAWLGSFTCFAVGDDRFGVIVAGQALLAAGYACLSGTDVTFHFDTLEALGRATEYADRQARVVSRGMVVGATGLLAGGLVGLVDVRLAFVLSLSLALAQTAISFRFVEAPHGDRADDIMRQVGTCVGYLRSAPIAWIFGYGVAMVVLEHVAFEMLQPWLTEALGRSPNDLGVAPLLSGATLAVMTLVGAAAARSSAVLGRALGVRFALVALGALSACIATLMAASTGLWVLALIAFRSVQGAAAPVLISAYVAPRIEQRHRATFLSLDSLAGRLTYGALLLMLSVDVGDDVSRVLWRLSAVSWTLVALTLLSAMWVRRRHGAAGLDDGRTMQ